MSTDIYVSEQNFIITIFFVPSHLIFNSHILLPFCSLHDMVLCSLAFPCTLLKIKYCYSRSC